MGFQHAIRDRKLAVQAEHPGQDSPDFLVQERVGHYESPIDDVLQERLRDP